MRDMVACLSEHAVRISETTCSSTYLNQPHNHRHHHQRQQLIPSASTPQSPRSSQQISSSSSSTQTAVSSVYKITLMSKPTTALLATLTWSSSRTQTGHHQPGGLTITFSSEETSTDPAITTATPTSFKLLTTATSRLFRRKKGTKSLDFNSMKIDLFWDFTDANYDYSPTSGGGVEPVDGFYLIVMVDAELGLMLGDLAPKKIKTIPPSSPVGKSTLVSRKEHYSGSGSGSAGGGVYSTKARFVDGGEVHEIVIRCCCPETDGRDLKFPGLSVSVDKGTVMRVKRLQWNFRGNQTVFVDGLLVDLFWDVHDWFFGDGKAVFMFRKRCGVDSRLWLQEKDMRRGTTNTTTTTTKGGGDCEREEKDEFSLLIYASK